jgi:hypothetical protein
MNDAEKICALAAELERLGKNPDYGDCASPEGLCPISDKLTLAALSGVAAKVRAEHGLCIVKSGDKGEWDEAGERIVYTSWVWELFNHGWENGSTLIEQYPSYEEAEIAALKTIESEVRR